MSSVLNCFIPEYEEAKIFRNVGNHTSNDMESQSRKTNLPQDRYENLKPRIIKY